MRFFVNIAKILRKALLTENLRWHLSIYSSESKAMWNSFY